MEFESFQDGVLLHIGIPEKQAAPVDSILGILGKEGEDISALLAGNTSEKPAEKTETHVHSSETVPVSKAELPAGVEVVRMPKLSDTMTEGVVAKWHKKVGDKVKSGELLADIETDKATMEFESFQDGVLIHIGVEAGKSAPVDSVLAILGKGGEDVKAILAAVGTSTRSKSETVSTPKAETQVQKVAATVTSTTTNVSNKTTNGRVKASPLAKALGKEKGIDISMVSGSGDNGRITKKDFETFTPGTSKRSFFTGGVERFTDEPASQMRKTIARVPLFNKQIKKKDPVTITHPDIIRYFMTIPEACQLVLEAGTMGKGGEIFIFDMGKPVKIIDLAKKMIRLAGYIPEKDIKIDIVGLRPGEKLYEELLHDTSKNVPTYHEKIMIAIDDTKDCQKQMNLILELISHCTLWDNYQIVAKMKEIVPEFVSLNSPYQALDN